MAKTKRATRTIDAERNTVTFDFIDGGSPLVCDMSKLPPHIVARLALHGLNQKVGDSFAGPDTDARHEASSTFSELVAGQWTMRGTGEPKAPTLLTEAVMTVVNRQRGALQPPQAPVTIEQTRAFLEEMSDEDRKAMKSEPAVAAEIAKITAERARDKARVAAHRAKEAGPSTMFAGLVG